MQSSSPFAAKRAAESSEGEEDQGRKKTKKEDAVQDIVDKSSHPNNFDLLQPGQVVKERWKVVRKIGAGGCGEVYEGVDLVTNEEVALKMESTRQGYQLLEREGYILKMLKEKHNACRFIGSGTENDLNYLVMQLQGNNLCHLRRAQPGRRLSWSTILRLGLEMLKAIHSVHQVGYLHRDVKPANFCVGRLYNNCRRVYIVDFGLAVRYRSETGKILAPLGLWLKGNKRYASINELKDKALGRRDDLWSLFYILVEFANGRLPWNELEDRTQVCKMKEKYSNRLLLLNLPFELHKFLDHLESLQCRDRPDYEMLTGLLEQSIERLRIKLSEPYDWEKATDTAVRSSISPVILRVAQPAIIRATHINDILDSSQSTEPDNNHEYETQLDCERLFDQLLQETSAPVTENPSDSKPEKGKSCNATLAATQAPNQPRDTKTELSQGSPRKQLVAQRREASMQGVDPTAEAHPHLHHFAASSAALTDNDVAFEGNNEMAQ